MASLPIPNNPNNDKINSLIDDINNAENELQEIKSKMINADEYEKRLFEDKCIELKEYIFRCQSEIENLKN